MKFAHLADLHLGISLNHIRMVEEQTYILDQIISILKEEKPDGLLIAGDVFDKAVPSAEAVVMLDHFLFQLAEMHMETFMIAGNHDSGDRLSYAGSLLEKQGIHITGNYTGKIVGHTMQDAYGEVCVWTLPFIRPSYVNRYLENDMVEDYTQAVQKAVASREIDESRRNVILSHQFVTGASVEPDGSEQLMVGGLDQVSASAYEKFDYAALGHIHSFQKVKGGEIYYSGTPLKYSFSEENDVKAVQFVELKEKGNVTTYRRELKPLHEMRTVKGKYADLLLQAQQDPRPDDFIRVILTDEEEIDQAVRHLRNVWPNVLRLDYDNARTKVLQEEMPEIDDTKTPLEVCAEFYQSRHHTSWSDAQQALMQQLIEKIWEGEE